MDIRKKVKQLIGLHKTRNPFDILSGMNVILVFYPLNKVRGFYQCFQRNNIIYINEKLSDFDRLFVCAHELGHMVMHKTSNAIFMDTRTNFNTAKYENEADKFAMELLISDDDLAGFRDNSIQQLSRLFGYHEKLIKLRFK